MQVLSFRIECGKRTTFGDEHKTATNCQIQFEAPRPNISTDGQSESKAATTVEEAGRKKIPT